MTVRTAALALFGMVVPLVPYVILLSRSIPPPRLRQMDALWAVVPLAVIAFSAVGVALSISSWAALSYAWSRTPDQAQKTEIVSAIAVWAWTISALWIVLCL